MAADAEDDNDVLRFLNDDILDNSQFMSSIFLDHESAGLLPANVTTSNVESTSNPTQPHQGVVADEKTNNTLITDHSSCNVGSVAPACDEDEVLSSGSSGTEASSESLVNTSEGNPEVKCNVPEIGMKFSCEEEALKFYTKYAVEMGFKVRKGKVQRLANKSISKRYFYCSKEGFRSKNLEAKAKKYTRKETRTGCGAMIEITFKNNECLISRFSSEHNHDLQGSAPRYHVDPCSKIPEPDSLIQPIHEIGTAKNTEAGACATFCDMSYSKHLHAKKIKILQPEDVQQLINCIKRLQLEDPSFFYTWQVDDETRLTNFFCLDSRSKIDYEYFGDVLILDTTFKADRYDMICAPFLGLNHHQQQVLFGCAFLLDESLESFTWLLGTFTEVMGGHQPKTVFTTECPAIYEAVEATLPKSQHRLCKQFVCRSAKQHLLMYYEQPGFESQFHSCFFDCQSEGVFQSMWSSLLEQYSPQENPWLQNIYSLRIERSYLFSKTFCAGIHSNQGSEHFSIANFFQNTKSEAMTLPDYVLKYEKAAKQLCREELHEDYGCSVSEPELILSSPMEKQAASLYTPTIFKKFRKELIGSMSVPLKRMARTGSFVTYKVTKGEKAESIVEFNSQDSTIKCSCKNFESVGILCSHALKLLHTRNIFEIPPQYILKRWTKFAKDGVKKGSAEVNHEDVRNTSSVASVDWQEKVEKDLYLNQGEASEETMEFQVQKKSKTEVRKKMNPPSSSVSLP